MRPLLRPLSRDIVESKGLWLSLTVGFVVAYYVLQLGGVWVGLGQAPNYIVWYDYFGNIRQIFDGTPSWSDAITIAQDEWLIEAGHMNYDFGKGVALWSLNVQPPRILQVLVAGALMATIVVLLRGPRTAKISRAANAGVVAAALLGIFCVSISNATLSWVVACLSPSWIATLHMIGMDGDLVNALEPYGGPLTIAGFCLLAASLAGLSIARVNRAGPQHPITAS